MNLKNCLPVLLLIVVLVPGCASGPGSKSAQRKALQKLDEGYCPEYIIFPGERSRFGRERYDHEASDTQLAAYRDREIANCLQRAGAGDATATRVLAEYGYVDHQPQQTAAAYAAYVETGSDKELLSEAGVKLYRIYNTGAPGVRRDSTAAFRYLGVAVRNGAAQYELLYAEELYRRGLYTDALPLYRSMVAGTSARAYSPEQLCEFNLRLADMYFRGRGMQENWYIGYYYWLQGVSLAKDPDFASCLRNSFINHRDRYAREQERRAAVERRLGYLGQRELKRVREAWESPEEKGLDYVAALEFRRPPAAIVDDPAPARSPVVARSAPWPAWRPLGGDICRLYAAPRSLQWSEVFRMRSDAIWTVRSTLGQSESVGSAVAVSPNRLVTNCHLIQLPAGVKLQRAGSAMSARVVAADREGDRCVLEPDKTLSSYVASGRSYRALPIGEDVAAIGNPKGLDTSLSRGIVGQKRERGGLTLLQTDAAISSGSSGGGLFDTAGNLVGITTFKVAAGESLNFAIAVDEFCR